MEIVWQIAGAVAVVAGLVGCVVPVVPGPVLAYCGFLCLLPTSHPPSMSLLLVFGALTAAVLVLDYVVPALGARKFKCSRWGMFGCFAGTVVGVFFFPLGLLAGPFFGALAGELVAGRDMPAAMRGGFGALLGFLSGVFLKLLACSLMAVWYVRAIRAAASVQA